jgi:hypothetical protein
LLEFLVGEGGREGPTGFMCKAVGEGCEGGVWSKKKLGVIDVKASDVKQIKGRKRAATKNIVPSGRDDLREGIGLLLLDFHFLFHLVFAGSCF